jgi:hypothetical protein
MHAMNPLAGSYAQTGFKTAGRALPTQTAMESAMIQADASTPKPWLPSSALFWFGSILAVTTGLLGASLTVGGANVAVGKKD